MIRVLVVSNQSVTRALFLSVLDASAHEVSTASWPAEALERAATVRPQVCVVDAQDVHGDPDFASRLRSASGREAGVLLVLRRRGEAPPTRAQLDALGVLSAFTLPPDRALLEELVSQAAERSGDTGSWAAPAPRPAAQPARAPSPVALESNLLARFHELDALDAYEVLGVERESSDDTLQTAFRRRCLQYHPDRSHLAGDSELRDRYYQLYKRITWAYRQVGDPAQRARYDATLG